MRGSAFSVTSFVFLLFSAFAQAAPMSQQIPYYGEQFFHDYASGVSNEDLKATINQVLRSSHLKSKAGLDEIVSRCGGSNCYQHISLGYNRARTFMMGVYYLVDKGHGNYAIHDVYCDKDFESNQFKKGQGPGPNKIPDGDVLNTEHTWPQSRFSARFDNEMQKSDIHHLFPSDNEMNSVRGNNPFGEVVQDSKVLKCRNSRTGSQAGGGEVFEPPANHRGNVARALFYFSVRYELPIDERQEATLRKWNREDPVDEEEIARNDAIQNIQGSRNPFVDYPELADRIRNF